MSARVRSTALLAVAAALALPASAQAVERFAAVGGAITGDCTVTPCTIERAAENQANPGDVVTVLPGNHDIGVGNLVIANAIEVRGAPGQPIPIITSASTSTGVTLNDAGASLRRLEIVHDDPADGPASALVLIQPATVEGVIARSGTNDDDAAGCSYDLPTGTSALIRDSVCSSSAADGQGLRVNTNGPGTTTLTVRNVTAVSVGDTGMRFSGTPATDVLNVNATSVIASGPVADVSRSGAAVKTVTLDHSNYDLVSGSGGGSITPVAPAVGNDPTNQTTPPVFVNAANGDFRQAPSSVGTIDLGSSAAGLGTADIEGEARTAGIAPDIGADELHDADGDGVLDVNDACPSAAGPTSTSGCPDGDGDGLPDASDNCPAQSGPASNIGCPVPPPDTDGDGIPDSSDSCPTQAAPGTANGCPTVTPPDTDKPQTKISKGPKGEIEADTATFKFSSDEQGSTFECRLVELGGGKEGRKAPKFKSCRSPRKLKNLDPSEYRFEVRATDAAGNTDSTAAKRTFEVVEQAKNR